MQYDPYFEGKMNQLQSNFLNFVPTGQNPATFFFSGNSYSLKKKAEEMSLTDEKKYQSMRINLTGTLVQPNNMCCFWWTIVLGSIFLFPFFFICCDWWKKRVNRLYNVENSGYDGLIKIMDKVQAEEVYILVQDNFFNRNKGEALIEALERRNCIKNLIFKNIAGPFDTDGSNYSDFPTYMKPIKTVTFRSDISWGHKIVN